ncbi:GNAT family N-acetyltransferase [Flavobacterium cerinum]|uniref:GNAT family N-acetyltransferase n=1 Tax=Flavobacterium cerinum TaxID=2502784 RepID=A0ABY5ILY2_9FLAO|nr:GNAT family N-acetyltransferase [Flavobacterium cerinum]UUC43845.1 GNAT family N-acetyltransferase [Flavobacterium cerinum]
MRHNLEGATTERLSFRKVTEDDFEMWLPFYSDETVIQNLGMTAIATAEERCRYWLNLTFERYKNNLGGAYIVTEKATGIIVGQSGLIVRNIDGILELEVTYSILPEHRGKGYASEAAQKCRDFAFEKEQAGSVISIINIHNTDSQKVAFQNGMQIDKTTEFMEMPVQIFRINATVWNTIKKPS